MKTQVFFDGSCPLCVREIGFYRRRRGADAITWTDISGAAEGEVAPGLEKGKAMGRFHVRRPDGRIVSGARAFAAMWRALPGFRLVGRIAGAWPVEPLLEAAYRAFLVVRPTIQRLTPAPRERCPRDA
ncbi:MAG: DUF393 domain-containing protein [Pseudomonadota bacterium]